MELINEAVTQSLYYFRKLKGLYDILKTNTIQMSVAFGTKHDMLLNKDKLYFISTSRIKWGGFSRSNFFKDWAASTIVLDGKKLSQRFKTFSVDYWGRDMRPNPAMDKERFLKNNENEERILSNTPILKSANKYIKEIHVFIPENIRNQDKTLLVKISKLNKKIYYYTDEAAFKTLDIRKAITNVKISDIDDSQDMSSEPDLYKRKYNTKIDTIIKLFNIKNNSEYSKLNYDEKWAVTEIKYGDERGIHFMDLVSGIEADIHNYKTNSEYRSTIHELAQLMLKTKSKNIKELLFVLQRKIWNDQINIGQETEQTMKEVLKRTQPVYYKKMYGKEQYEYEF